MSNTRPMSLIWWDNLNRFDKQANRVRYSMKDNSRKEIDRVYRLQKETN